MTNEAKNIARRSKSSFYYAFSLLPHEQREAMNTVYAFCRKTDDIVDEGNEPTEIKYQNLRKWKQELEKALMGKSDYSLLNKLTDFIRQFNIPIEPFFELIDGMEMDLQKNRYLSFDELKMYCYSVASTVGLMCIEIFGYKNARTRDFAVNLGLAMQLTNILRDIRKDAQIGRIYLPQEDFKKFKYSEKELFNNIYNENFRSLMAYEAERAKSYFVEATRSLDITDKPSMFPARAMQHIYFNLLQRLEKEEFDVLNKTISVPKVEKFAIAFGVWAKYSLVY